MLLTQGWGQIAESSNYACTSHRFIFLELSLWPWFHELVFAFVLEWYQHRAGMRIHVSKSTLQKLQQAREFQWFCQSTGKVVSSSTIIYKRPHKSGKIENLNLTNTYPRKSSLCLLGLKKTGSPKFLVDTKFSKNWTNNISSQTEKKFSKSALKRFSFQLWHFIWAITTVLLKRERSFKKSRTNLAHETALSKMMANLPFDSARQWIVLNGSPIFQRPS